MRIPATINGQQYVLDYGTNPRGQVAGVAIYSADGLTDLSAELDSTPTEYAAWDIARAHRKATVPSVPALVAVPHVFESSQKKHAAEALNADAMLIAMHALHVEAIAQGSNRTTTSALNKAYLAMKREAGQAFAHAKLAGGLLFALHGSKAFEVAA